MKQDTEWIEWFCFFFLILSYSGGSRGGIRGARAPLSLDQTKARRPPSPPYVSGSGWPPPPPPPYLKVWILLWVNQVNWRVGFSVVILSGFCRLLLNRELKQRRRRQQRIRQKSIRFRSEEQQLCTCCHTLLYISRPKLQSTTWNFLISRFMEDGNARRFCFSFNELR